MEFGKFDFGQHSVDSKFFWIICQPDRFPFKLFIMDYEINTATLRIPESAYQKVKRCPYCQSVFINSKACEACGRSLLYHPIGDPFGPKSFFGMKERYIENQNAFLRFFPQFEDRKSPEVQSFIRNLSKRFADLISAFNSQDVIKKSERKLFYIESMEIIDEMLRYAVHPQIIQVLLEENDNSLIGQELLFYLEQAKVQISADLPWHKSFLQFRAGGMLRMEFLLKAAILTTTVLTLAVQYKDIISSQFGK